MPSSRATFACCGTEVPRNWAGSHSCIGRPGGPLGTTTNLVHKPGRSHFNAKAGARHEEALYAALDGDGFMDFRYATDGGGYLRMSSYYIRQYPWGAYLTPPRRFSADAGFPTARLLVEVEGQVHSIKGKRGGDVKRRQLAEEAGWRVLSVLPEQVHNGEAVELVRRALETRRAP